MGKIRDAQIVSGTTGVASIIDNERDQ